MYTKNALLRSHAGIQTNLRSYKRLDEDNSMQALKTRELVHFHFLLPNEPHPCDKYGCAREAKYQLGKGYYCHDRSVSHFMEVANTCQREGFELIEDQQQFDEPGNNIISKEQQPLQQKNGDVCSKLLSSFRLRSQLWLRSVCLQKVGIGGWYSCRCMRK